MFDWTVLNLQNERGRAGGAGGSADRPVSVPRAEDPRDGTGGAGGGGGLRWLEGLWRGLRQWQRMQKALVLGEKGVSNGFP